MKTELMNEDNRIARMFRSPTLETVNMVERTVKDNSGEFKKTQIWEMLDKKIMWPTYLVVLNYLQEINKIIISDDGIITYIWNPTLLKKLSNKKRY